MAIEQMLAFGMGEFIAVGFLVLGLVLAAYAIWYMMFRMGN